MENIVLSSTDFQEKNGNIFTFPNPVTNKLIIELPLDFKESFVISVFNIEGKLIKKQIEICKYFSSYISIVY